MPSYDYSTPGVYFVTVVVQQRACVLGEIHDGQMRLSHFGMVVESWWDGIEFRFPEVQLDAYVTMPNHLHGLLRIGFEAHEDRGESVHINEPAGNGSVSLGAVMNWFKSITTRDYQVGVDALGWPPYPRRLWQRNYYEHIVRDDADLDRIRSYIEANPFRWAEDEELRNAPRGFGGNP